VGEPPAEPDPRTGQGSAVWPRLMTGPHPAAAGSYGPEAVAWAEARRLQPRRSAATRWWQRLALARILEHDSGGDLVWPVAIVSGPRQVGKSWAERIACGWRLSQGDRFGEEQTILHVAHKLTAAQEVWRPAARHFAGRDQRAAGAAVRWANGEQQIELADGSRWLIQAANDGAGVAFTLTGALVDEGWRVARRVYEEGIEPALAEARSGQTLLVSTAGTATSDLMLTYRAAAIATLEDPGDTLLIEWSAPPDPELDIDDPAVWRACQPHWDGRREAWIRRKRENADEHAFRQHALNQWVPSLTLPVLPPGTWPAVVTRRGPTGGITFGVEIADDHTRAVIIAYGGGVAEVVDEREAASATWIPPRLADLAARHHPAAVALDGTGPARSLAEPVDRALGEAGPPLLVLGGRDMAAGSGQLLDLITGRGIGLRDHPLMQAAVESARRRGSGAWVWDRAGPGIVMVAATAAMWAGSHAPAPATPDEDPAVFV
jgi:hypothetical protein